MAIERGSGNPELNSEIQQNGSELDEQHKLEHQENADKINSEGLVTDMTATSTDLDSKVNGVAEEEVPIGLMEDNSVQTEGSDAEAGAANVGDAPIGLVEDSTMQAGDADAETGISSESDAPIGLVEDKTDGSSTGNEDDRIPDYREPEGIMIQPMTATDANSNEGSSDVVW